MKGYAVFVAVAMLGMSFSMEAKATTPKEMCGVNAPIKYMRFRHQANLISDIASIYFTPDGGFVIYDEDGANHFWHLEAGNYSLGYRTITTGAQSFTKHTFASMTKNWLPDFTTFVTSMTNMSGYVIQSEFKEATVAQVEVALNCAHKILFNALARGQESFLDNQQGLQ